MTVPVVWFKPSTVTCPRRRRRCRWRRRPLRPRAPCPESRRPTVPLTPPTTPLTALPVCCTAPLTASPVCLTASWVFLAGSRGRAGRRVHRRAACRPACVACAGVVLLALRGSRLRRSAAGRRGTVGGGRRVGALPPARVAIAALGAAGTPAAVVRSRGRGGGGGVARQRRRLRGLDRARAGLVRRRLCADRRRLLGRLRHLLHPDTGAHARDQQGGSGGGLAPTARELVGEHRQVRGERGAAAARGRRRRVGAAPEALRRSGTAAGRRRARRSARARAGGRTARGPARRPAPRAGSGWQCERWRARRRVSRVPSRLSAAVMMIPWMRRQRAPETMSSNSSVSRRRARNSVDSTAGRLIPMRRPISA